MEWKNQIDDDIKFIINQYGYLNIKSISLGGSCAWGCANPHDIDYIVYVATPNQHFSHIHYTKSALPVNVFVYTDGTLSLNPYYDAASLARSYMSQNNPEIILYGKPAIINNETAHLIIKNAVCQLKFVLCNWKRPSKVLTSLLWLYYILTNQTLTIKHKQQLELWHNKQSTYNEVQELCTLLERYNANY